MGGLGQALHSSSLSSARSNLKDLKREFPGIESKIVSAAYFRHARLQTDAVVKAFVPIFVMKGAKEELRGIEAARKAAQAPAECMQAAVEVAAQPRKNQAPKNALRRVVDFLASLARGFGPTQGGSTDAARPLGQE